MASEAAEEAANLAAPMVNRTCPRGILPASNSSWWSPANCAAVACFAARGGCPSGSWKDATATAVAALASAREPLILVNAGANKGYAVAEWTQRFGAAEFTLRDWYTNLTAIKATMMLRCGYCRACNAPDPMRRPHPGGVHAYAVELLGTNAIVLRMMMERMRITGATSVHEMALSNYSGDAYRPLFHRTGEEDVGAQSTAGRHTARVESLTLDDFAARQSIRTIHTLSLDAEGWDSRILHGAATLLREKRIGLLEFEYAPKAWATAAGLWKIAAVDDDAAIRAGRMRHPALPLVARELAQTVGWLSDMGYQCFWQGRDEDTLLGTTRERIEACHDAIAGVPQGNLVCAPSQSAVLERLRTLRLPTDKASVR